MRFFKTFYHIFKEPSVLCPDVTRQSLKGFNFQGLKDLGIKFIVFDKDNTLTKTYEWEFYGKDIENSIFEAKNKFGAKNLAILSNSSDKTRKFWKDLEIVDSKGKKPFNFIDAKKHFGENCKNEEIAIFGDRLMTDIMMANLNGALGVYLDPLERSHEPVNIKFLRFWEDWALKFLIRGRKNPKNFDQKKLKQLEQ